MGCDTSHPRRFQADWFKIYPWLEYSESEDKAFCLPCFLFNKTGNPTTFTINGYQNWKNVHNGEKRAFMTHMEHITSTHDKDVKAQLDLLNQSQHIPQVFDKHSLKERVQNQMRLKVFIDAKKYLALQGLAFRGHDEKEDSINRGNFLQLVKLLGSYDEKVQELLLKAPHNAAYTSGQIQKEIIEIISKKMKKKIREEVSSSKFCVIADESEDGSHKVHIAIVLRFVDKFRILRERFFDVIHVKNTASLILKNEIVSLLSRHGPNIQNIRGQGYDSANNMHGQFNGLQALITMSALMHITFIA